MSPIHTCQLCGVNSFDYLVELQRHARELAANPAEWMPWNFARRWRAPEDDKRAWTISTGSASSDSWTAKSVCTPCPRNN